MKKEPIHLDFEIDKLTNSIENRLTEDSFPTDILLATKEDMKAIHFGGHRMIINTTTALKLIDKYFKD